MAASINYARALGHAEAGLTGIKIQAEAAAEFLTTVEALRAALEAIAASADRYYDECGKIAER